MVAGNNLIIMLVLCYLCLPMSVAASDTQESVTITQKTPGKNERFTQTELDIAFKKQMREQSKLIDSEGIFYQCCTLYYSDIKIINKVLKYFMDNLSENINKYGIIIREDEEHLIFHFKGKYRVETQYFSDGYWHPGVGGDVLSEYICVVDRSTLNILDFRKVPS